MIYRLTDERIFSPHALTESNLETSLEARQLPEVINIPLVPVECTPRNPISNMRTAAQGRRW